ncbi:SMI1/KNR4 family protein (plasmid) [Nostoc edaphicum CCNP1411]|uniref:SMI1/KNR4 family protein n=1 Tax=Nostoc edaphicum CCNP1411 TaxID=1472755 RepID=A0A7D7L8J1_9NOSO|nr:MULTISPECIES: SMI1/KNR4 family protein [Nostoc]ODH02839.1 SMI1 / KNR4 family protein [Nostoc sp. KVJ20]QMS86058.1 SMI1/KNR4 family protein [Nostoc edaphicum CCNP1411]
MNKYFIDCDLNNFWSDNEYAKKYQSAPVTYDLIEVVEKELGFKLPQSYIELMKTRNGGIPNKTFFATTEETIWGDRIAIEGIFGIGVDSSAFALCGNNGNHFWINEWGYPDFGVYICDTPSGGHDLIMLDYRKCGKNGEPEVAHVDQENDYKVTTIVKNFETFITGLTGD